MKDFTVIMPCWLVNERLIELTKNAIDSLGEVDLILVDNASPIGGGFLRDKADLYIRNKENLGYAKAMNQGLKLAKTKFIALVNNDIRISPGWQEVAKEVLEAPNTYSCHFRMTDYDIPFEYGQKIVYQGMERWCTGSFYIVKSPPCLYDENYLNSYDDWDLFLRVRRIGYKTAYTDRACYQHHHSFTQKQLPVEHAENNQKNIEYFKKKWGMTAEELFAKEFPEQMKVPYSEGFKI